MAHISSTLSPAFKLSLVSIDKDAIRVAAEGPITYESVIAEKNPLANLLGETWSSNRVLLSLDKTHFIDSSAIGWLISTHKEFKASNGKFVVHSIRPPVRQVLDLLKVGKVVCFADNEQAARAMANG